LNTPSKFTVVRRKRSQSGFSLFMLAASATVMLGMVGLSVDLGRMFIVKNELQAFTDASALAAVRQMDGTRTGLQLAHNTATAGPLGSSRPNGWMFDTNPVSQITDVYAQAFTGSYDDYGTASSAGANNYRFIKVTVQATVPLYFLPVVSGLPQQQQVQALAIAGQQAQAASSPAEDWFHSCPMPTIHPTPQASALSGGDSIRSSGAITIPPPAWEIPDSTLAMPPLSTGSSISAKATVIAACAA
jgi:Flp pilus assembly protein TadG